MSTGDQLFVSCADKGEVLYFVFSALCAQEQFVFSQKGRKCSQRCCRDAEELFAQLFVLVLS